nr:hypothetical protein [Tanacetum cinerariifolium]
MAALQYKAEHNKVGYLLKLTESDDYHNIIDFLRSSHIRYALTANPIIFGSLVKQFWSTATLRPPELGPPAILATIDRIPYIITKDLVCSSLQLANDGGVTDLPIPEIYYGMDALGYVTEGALTGQTIFLGECKLFANMRVNFASNPMPLLPAMLLQALAGEGAQVAAQDVPHPVPAPDQSPPHLTTPSRPHSHDLVALLLEHAHTSTQLETAAGSFPSTKDAPIGGDFHTSPLRSSHTPPAGQSSEGAEDLITLTALSYVVLTLVQKVHFLEAELHDHKKPFKDVVGKLVKKVNSLEVKLKTKKRKMVVSDSDEEDGTTPNVHLDALRALANAAMAVDSDVIPTASPCAPTNVPVATSTTHPDAFGIAPDASGVAPNASGIAPDASGVAPDASGIAPNAFGVAPGASGVAPGAFGVAIGDTDVSSGVSVASTDPIIPTAVPVDRLNDPAGASNKGKSPMIEEDIPVLAMTFRQMEEDRLGEEAARRLHEEEMVEMEKERTKAQRKRQQEVLESAKFYNEDDWLNIKAQVKANASLSKTLLGDDVSEDNFPARMAALIRKKRQALAEQLFKERQNRPLTPAQQKAYMRHYVKSFSAEQLLQEFEKICKVQSQSQFQAFSRTLKRPGSVLEEPPTKKPKSLEAPTPSMPKIPISPAATSPPSSRTRRKSLVNEDSDDEDSVDEVWFAFVGWEILSTPLGDINALYRIDDVSYPLSVELMKKMLLHKLEIDSDFVGNDLTTADS